ncbi:hypothetical protein [Verrucomicrobium sp. BvORR034]|uniref:hypothetical protein n=1 Tax=Verrucomicrobium sp. BvORR034 TaxID=1396418 RepID=UPI000679211E|nr:hypothetical protein [Verrucomicrobium sp. BvORR034]
MLYGLLTGRTSVVAALLLAGAIIGKKLNFKSMEDRAKQDQLTQKFAPALNQMSAEALSDSTWHYDGPLGKLELRFLADGKLECTRGASTESGSWRINDVMLFASIPGETSEHGGIFRESTAKIEGATPKRWSAVRKTAADE